MKVIDKEWYKAQALIQGWLRSNGINTFRAGYFAPFDLYTKSGTRIEVKWAEFRQLSYGAGWLFNIHRHGKVANGEVDFYILRCEGIKLSGLADFNNAFHVIVPSPVEIPTISISVRSLLIGIYKAAHGTEEIRMFDENIAASRQKLTGVDTEPRYGRGRKKKQ